MQSLRTNICTQYELLFRCMINIVCTCETQPLRPLFVRFFYFILITEHFFPLICKHDSSMSRATKCRWPKGPCQYTLDKSINVELNWAKQIKMTNSEVLFPFIISFFLSLFFLLLNLLLLLLVKSGKHWYETKGNIFIEAFIKKKRGGWLLFYWFKWSVALNAQHWYGFLNKRTNGYARTTHVQNKQYFS